MTFDEAVAYMRRTLDDASRTWHAGEALGIMLDGVAKVTAERDRLRDALGVALEARDNWRAETNALAIERAEWESVVAERDRLREQLEEADTLIGDLQSGYSFTDHDARSMSAWRADRALKATGETPPTPASKGPTK